MKTLYKVFGIIALAAVIAFAVSATFAACGGGTGGPQTVTYTGTSGGTAYTLKITENTARYTAQIGDTYELTVGGKTSTGTVTNVSSGVLTLTPGNSSTSFTATVSDNGIASMTGTITFTDGSTAAAPSALTPGTPPAGAPGTFTLTGIPSQYNGKYAGFVFEGSGVSLLGAQSVSVSAGSSTVVAVGVLISGGSVTIPVWTPNSAGTAFVQYSGSATVEGGVGIYNQSTLTLDFNYDDETLGSNPQVLLIFQNVAFSNGGAARAWSQGQVNTNPGGGNTPGTPTNPTPGNGSFTLTGIPSQYNGKWVVVEAGNNSASILGAQSINAATGTFTAVPISGGSASIPVWHITGSDANPTVTRYGGSHTVELIAYIISVATITESTIEDVILIAAGWRSVAFASGSATRAWGSADEYETDFSGGGAPPAPTGVTAAREQTNQTTIKVSWNAVSGAERYKVYRSSTAGGTGTQVADTKGETALIANCSVDATYYFRVIAENSREVQGAPSSWVSVGPAAGGDAANFTYTETTAAVTITGYNGTSKDITIPAAINGKPVTTIGRDALSSKQLTGVTIPGSVTTIGDYSFENNQLTSLTIPSSVTGIGARAFTSNKLTSLTIPNSVTVLGVYAFANNQLTSVTIGNGITIIQTGAFRNNQLASVTIPNQVITVNDIAFENNPLTSVTIGTNVTVQDGKGSYTSGPAFPGGLPDVYNNGKAAGTYTRPSATSTTWTKQ